MARRCLDAQINLPIYSAGAADSHTAALAMPIFGANLRLVGALALSGPVARLTPDRAQEIKPYLHAAAMRLTKSLGGSFETAQAHRAMGK